MTLYLAIDNTSKHHADTFANGYAAAAMDMTDDLLAAVQSDDVILYLHLTIARWQGKIDALKKDLTPPK